MSVSMVEPFVIEDYYECEDTIGRKYHLPDTQPRVPLPERFPAFDEEDQDHYRQIVFQEEGHIYSVDWDGTGEFTTDRVVGTTSFIEYFFEKFDTNKTIRSSKDYDEEKDVYTKGKYEGKSMSEVSVMWKQLGLEARTTGTFTHGEVERIIRGQRPVVEEGDPDQLLVFQHFLSLDPFKGEVPFSLEKALLTDSSSRVVGTPDGLFVITELSQGDTLYLHLWDWKCSKGVGTFAFGDKRGLYACERLTATQFVKYCLQGSIYAHMAERLTWKWKGKVYKHCKVVKMTLGVFHPGNLKLTKPIMMPLVRFENEVKDMLALRTAYLQSGSTDSFGDWLEAHGSGDTMEDEPDELVFDSPSL